MDKNFRQQLHDIAVVAHRGNIEVKYKPWFDDMIAVANEGKFHIRWPSTEESFPQELAEYLFIELDMPFYYYDFNGIFCGVVHDLREGWRKPENYGMYIEVRW